VDISVEFTEIMKRFIICQQHGRTLRRYIQQEIRKSGKLVDEEMKLVEE